jgi:Nif-specific regulatory protein
VVIDGPDRGSKFRLGKGEHVVGRGADAEVRLTDEAVSRRHAILTVDDGITVVDLGSHNGTQVNGQRVESGPVAVGDQVRFGDTTCLVEPAMASSVATVSVQIVEPSSEPAASHRAPVSLPEDRRRLALLYEVGNTINSAVRLPELLERILATIFEVVPAERGAILLWRDAESEWQTAAVHARKDGADLGSITVSRAIIDHAFASDEPIVSADATADKRFGPSDSIEEFAVRSTICCALRVRSERLGVLYLDTRQATGVFSDADVQLVGAIGSQAAIAIANARLHEGLREENVQLRRALGSRHAIVGQSRQMKELMDLVRRVGRTQATVLLRGESGVGKEVVARTLHALSPRRAKAFVCVNCAAVPETLLESELFGHEEGAFTGAVRRRIGRFEQANSGTIFLDEIGEMPVGTQAKILRVLQEREFRRVGGTRPVRVDVRLVASTNRDLAEAMEANAFREDLYYRLKVIDIEIPPLRERTEDILPLCEHFLSEVARDMGRPAPAISREAMRLLLAYQWPGNVRELRNVMERIMVLGVEDSVAPGHIPVEVRQGVLLRDDLPADLTLAAQEASHVAAVLQLTGWNKSKAAELLGISRPRLDRKIQDYGLRPQGE